ncbi:MAG TPA: STAS domain-containing protein [Acidimicrobiales bacterium]|nr:STAS domain-containing protein [Acidimicrobiales bacterium]
MLPQPLPVPTLPPLAADHPAGHARPGALELHADDRGRCVRLHVEGDLDAYNAPQLVEAMAWLRRRHDGGIVLDLHDVRFVDMSGYRAIHRASCDSEGRPDPHVVRVIGPVVAKLELVVALATGR